MCFFCVRIVKAKADAEMKKNLGKRVQLFVCVCVYVRMLCMCVCMYLCMCTGIYVLTKA